MPKEDSIKAGVSDAWDFWLSQHDVSVPWVIQLAVKDAVSEWMNSHADELVEAIATKVAEGAP